MCSLHLLVIVDISFNFCVVVLISIAYHKFISKRHILHANLEINFMPILTCKVFDLVIFTLMYIVSVGCFYNINQKVE